MESDALASTGAREVNDMAGGGLAIEDLEASLTGFSTETGRRRGAASPPRRRRQWGAERPRPPLPMQEKPAGTAATWLGGLAISITVVAWAVYLVQVVVSRFIDSGFHDSKLVIQTAFYVGIMTLLLLSALMYLLARQGALYRSRGHVRVPRAEVDAFMANSGKSLTVLVPSYSEEPSVVRATLLSAALQEYPGMRIVLLIDDPPEPTDLEALARLGGLSGTPWTRLRSC